MSSGKKTNDKSRLHPRNKNRERYDLDALIVSNPELKAYIKPNKYGLDSVNFADSAAVRLLNKAILNHYYGIKNWVFPEENLCPPIPGRADYIHHIADLLGENNFGTTPTGGKVTCLDVGVGASCIYPLIGVSEYNWNFIGSDIDPKSIASAEKIVSLNPATKDKVTCRLQKSSKDFFFGVVDKEEKIEITICNPPFHASIEEAQASTRRKVRNLTGKDEKTPLLNFAGINNELVYEGGEHKFIHNLITESEKFAKNFIWFTTLVSKQSNLKGIHKLLKTMDVNQIREIPMGTGNKSTRIIAWTFLSREEQKEWSKVRWGTTLKKKR